MILLSVPLHGTGQRISPGDSVGFRFELVNQDKIGPMGFCSRELKVREPAGVSGRSSPEADLQQWGIWPRDPI